MKQVVIMGMFCLAVYIGGLLPVSSADEKEQERFNIPQIKPVLIVDNEFESYIIAKQLKGSLIKKDQFQEAPCVVQELEAKNKPSLRVTTGYFETLDQAVEGAKLHIDNVANRFKEGLWDNNSIGEKCWSSGGKSQGAAIMLVEGNYCVLISAPTAKENERVIILNLAKLIDKKIIAYQESKNKPIPLNIVHILDKPVTLLEFILTNNTKEEIWTTPICTNYNRVVIVTPDGKEQECYVSKKYEKPPIVLKSSEKTSWRLDIAELGKNYGVSFDDPGTYKVYWKLINDKGETREEIKSEPVLFLKEVEKKEPPKDK